MSLGDGSGTRMQTLSNVVDTSYQSFASSQHSTHRLDDRELTLLSEA